MDNTHTYSAPAQKKGSKLDLQSFAAGFLLAAGFFMLPLYSMTQEVTASIMDVQVSDVDGDGIPDTNDAGLGPVQATEDEVCEATDVNEDGVVDENEGCPEEVAVCEATDVNEDGVVDENEGCPEEVAVETSTEEDAAVTPEADSEEVVEGEAVEEPAVEVEAEVVQGEI